MYCGSIGKSICARRKPKLKFVSDFRRGFVRQRLRLGRARLQSAFLFQEKAAMSVDIPAYTAFKANGNNVEPNQIEFNARNELCVAVISTLGCPYCKQVKSSLKLTSIPFVEVDLSDHQECLQEVKSLTGKVTVPQVFVGGNLVGGAEETENAIRSGSIWELIEDAGGKGALPQSLQKILEDSKVFKGRDSKSSSALLGEEMNTLEKFNSQHGFVEEDLVAWLETSKGMDPAGITEAIADLKTTHVIVRQDNNHLSMLSSISIATRGGIERPLNSHFQWYSEARHPVEVRMS
jgi:glutaredoxin